MPLDTPSTPSQIDSPMPKPPLAPLSVPAHRADVYPASAPTATTDTSTPPLPLPDRGHASPQPLSATASPLLSPSPSPTPLRAPSPIPRPSHPGPKDRRDRERLSQSADTSILGRGLGLADLHALCDSLPPVPKPEPRPSPPSLPTRLDNTLPSIPSSPTSPLALSPPSPHTLEVDGFGLGRRGSLPLSDAPLPPPPAPTPATLEGPVIPLGELRLLAASGGDFSHFPGVSFHPSGRGKHTVIHRAVPGGLFGPDLAARLVGHLAAEPLTSPWLSPRSSPSIVPLALPADYDEAAPASHSSATRTQSQPPQTTSARSAHSRTRTESASKGICKENEPKTPGPRTPASMIGTFSGHRTPPPLSLPLALAGSTPGPGPSPRLREAWWGTPSVRAAAWSALVDEDDDPGVPISRVSWNSGGAFGISRDSVSMAGSPGKGHGKGTPLITFAFLPPFEEEEVDTLRALLSGARGGEESEGTDDGIDDRGSPQVRRSRSAAPSPETPPSAFEAGSMPPSPSPMIVGGTASTPHRILGFHPSGVTEKTKAGAGDEGPLETASGISLNKRTEAEPHAETPVAVHPGNPAPDQFSVQKTQDSTPALSSPPQQRRNTLSLFGLSPRKTRK